MDLPLQSLLRASNDHSLAALVLLFWEALITSGDELHYIWRKPNAWVMKWLFLFLRYCGIFAQFATLLVSIRLPLSPDDCKLWFTAQTVIIQSMLTAVELVLMIRVYALHNRSRRVAMLLAFFLFAEIITTLLTWRAAVPKLHFSPTCFTKIPPNITVYFLVATTSNQLVLLILTLGKCSFGARAIWGRTPLVSAVTRAGTAAFFVIFGMLLFLTIIHATLQNSIPFITVHWFFPLLSVAGCRLVLNMQNVAVPPDPSDFTTVFSL